MKYVIKLSNTSWIADWEGDLGRTIVLQNARIFDRFDSAERCLTRNKKAYPNRDFSKAKVVEIRIEEQPNE